MAAWTAF
jgi:methionine aminopeptidase